MSVMKLLNQGIDEIILLTELNIIVYRCQRHLNNNFVVFSVIREIQFDSGVHTNILVIL